MAAGSAQRRPKEAADKTQVYSFPPKPSLRLDARRASRYNISKFQLARRFA